MACFLFYCLVCGWGMMGSGGCGSVKQISGDRGCLGLMEISILWASQAGGKLPVDIFTVVV